MLVQTTPVGTHSTDLLHVVLPSTAQSTSTFMATSTVLSSPLPSRLQQICRHVNSSPIAASYPLPLALSLASSVLQSSKVLTQFDSQFSTGFYSGFPILISPKVFNCIQLSFPDLIWLTVSDRIGFTFLLDLIWLTFTVIVFDSSQNIRVPFQSDFRESHSFQGVLDIMQYLNHGKFHNYENWNYFGREHSKSRKVREKNREHKI